MPSADDEMETKFVHADDAVWRERIVWKLGFGIGAFGGIQTLLGLALGIAALATDAEPGLAVVGGLITSAGVAVTLAGLLAGVLRTAVTPSALRVQFMLAAVEIPFERLRSIRAEAYDWTSYGGWGYRVAPSGKRAMSVTGAGDRGVALLYEDEAGHLRSLFVSSRDPEALVAALDAARTKRGVTRVRVGGVTDAEDSDVGATETARAERARRER